MHFTGGVSHSLSRITRVYKMQINFCMAVHCTVLYIYHTLDKPIVRVGMIEVSYMYFKIGDRQTIRPLW